MALADLTQQLRAKKTDLLFRESHITLLGILAEWRDEAVSALEGQNPRIDAALKVASDSTAAEIERVYTSIIDVFKQAMNLPAGESEAMIGAIKALQREMRQWPDTRKTARGTVKTAYSIAKSPLDDMATKAIRLIEKRKQDLIAVGKRLGIDPADVNNDDLDKDPEDGVMTTGAKQLGSRFNSRASSRSAVWAFMSDLTGRQMARRKAQKEAAKKAQRNRGAADITLATIGKKDVEQDVNRLRGELSEADMRREDFEDGKHFEEGGKLVKKPVPAEAEGPSVTPIDDPTRDFGERMTSREQADIDREMERRVKEDQEAKAKVAQQEQEAQAKEQEAKAKEAQRRERAKQQPRYAKGHEKAGQFRPKDAAPTPATDETTDSPVKAAQGDMTKVLISIDETLNEINQHERAQAQSLHTLATLSMEDAQAGATLDELREDQTPDSPLRAQNRGTGVAAGQSRTGGNSLVDGLTEGLTSGLTSGLMRLLPGIVGKVPGILRDLLGGGGRMLLRGGIWSALGIGTWNLGKEIWDRRSEIDENVKNLTDAQKEYAKALKNVETTASLAGGTNKYASVATFGVLPEWLMPGTYMKQGYEKYLGSQYLLQEQERLGLTDADVAQVRGTHVPVGGKALPRIQRYMSTSPSQYSPRRAHSQDVMKRIGSTLTTEATTKLPPEFVAAILGNIEAESAYNAGIMNQIGAFGLTQVLDSKVPGVGRKTNLMKFAAEYTGQPTITQDQVGRDVELQTRFLLAEMGLLGDKWKKYVDPQSASMFNKTLPKLTAELDTQGASESQRIAAMAAMFMGEFERPSAKEQSDSISRRVQSATTARYVLGNAGILPASSPTVGGDVVASGRAQTTQKMAQAAASGQTDPALTTVLSSNRTSNVVVNAPSGAAASSLPPPIDQRLSILLNSR